MPYGPADNFLEPPQNITINGIPDAFSERFADQCTPWKTQPPPTQPFDFGKILIVGNGQCASACAVFVTIMQELHGVKVANFGAAKNSHSGMASGAVLNWSLLDSEAKVSVIYNEMNGVADSGAFLRLRALRTARGQARISLSMPNSRIIGGKRRSDVACKTPRLSLLYCVLLAEPPTPTSNLIPSYRTRAQRQTMPSPIRTRRGTVLRACGSTQR